MSLQSEVETELLELLDPDIYGRSMVIDGATVTAILAPDLATIPGAFDGQIVERSRLIAYKTAVTAIVGAEKVIDGKIWTVVGVSPYDLITSCVVERYTA